MTLMPLFMGIRVTLVSTGNRAVDHHIFIVMIGSHMPKNPFDNATFVIETLPPVHVFPVAEPERQITPRNACAITIQHNFHKQTVISGPVSLIWSSRPERRCFIRSH